MPSLLLDVQVAMILPHSGFSKVLRLRNWMVSALVTLVAFGASCKPKLGDSCSNHGDAKCMDPSAAILCQNKKWTRLECRGAKGCLLAGAIVECDASAAAESDFCDREGNFSCSTDRKSQLKCEKNAWKLDMKCQGPKGCSASATLVECDDSVATLGDPCPRDDHHTCAADKASVLVCKAGKFVLSMPCAKGPTCKVDGSTVGCD
jgi:hypothetical protein